MIGVIIYLIFHFCTCFLIFELVQKPFFCLYNRKINAEKFTPRAVRDIYSNGYRTDLIAASYLTFLPLLVCWVHLHVPFYSLLGALTAVNFLLAGVISIITLSDTLLYSFWQSKLDSSVFAYLRSLKGVFASVSTSYIILATLAWALLWAIVFLILNGVAGALLTEDGAVLSRVAVWHIVNVLMFFGLIGALFLIIRGEGIRPNNPSLAYFSKNVFYSHCALNPMYNLIYSLSVKDEFKGRFRAFSDEECREKFEGLYPTSGTPQIELLNTSRPNILLVVWESLGARFMETLGGKADVATNMDRLSKEGVLFTRCDSGSFRTDRALVCILSGYLGQPTTSVIRHTRKLPHLPALARRLRDDLGYETTAVHGGDCYIMHKSDYYIASGHDTLISQKDLPATAEACKWGIHDGYMFDWIYDDILRRDREESGRGWLTTFQTLSSHEPFVVPYHRLENEMDNAFAYTDDCFGKFVDKLKKTPAWDNLLIVVTGDHSINEGKPLPRDQYAHIPLLMLGGAVKKPMRIDTIMSQTDIAATLLGQMGLKHDEFRFSRDVLADTYTYPFSFHTYNNGFLYRDATGFTHYDNVSQTALEGADEKREGKAKAILQTLYEDLAKL